MKAESMSPPPLLIFKIGLAIWDPLQFHMWILVSAFNFCKKGGCNFNYILITMNIDYNESVKQVGEYCHHKNITSSNPWAQVFPFI